MAQQRDSIPQQQEQQEQQQLLPLLVGLTGSIGMGKSTVSGFLQQLGVPVLSADEIVHSMYAPGGAGVGPVAAAFPSALSASSGGIDRAALSAAVVGNEAAMQQLEALVHPLVEAERLAFVQRHARASPPAELLVFDIPLLFETGAEAQLDVVLVASAPADAQRARVLARPGMTAAKLDAILGRQVPDAEKRARADHVIDTGTSLEATRAQVAAVVAQLRALRLARGSGGGGGSGDVGVSAGAAAGAAARMLARDA